jgi:predicted alpha/beta-hydrolase family hydrolase
MTQSIQRRWWWLARRGRWGGKDAPPLRGSCCFSLLDRGLAPPAKFIPPLCGWFEQECTPEGHRAVSENKISQFIDETDGEAPVRGFLHSAGKESVGAMVLIHGAGGNCNAPLLVALATKFAGAGVTTLRCDLPFRQRRATGPPSPSDAKRDQQGLRRAVTLMRERMPGRCFLGGSSYGGRQASMLLANEPSLVDGLLLLSYPLHPPGRAAKLRTEHLPQLQTPTLFISGTKDAFGSIAELESAIKLIPGRTKLVAIEGAGHGLWQKSNREKLPEMVEQAFWGFFGDG